MRAARAERGARRAQAGFCGGVHVGAVAGHRPAAGAEAADQHVVAVAALDDVAAPAAVQQDIVAYQEVLKPLIYRSRQFHRPVAQFQLKSMF